MFEALIAAGAVAFVSLIGALVFGGQQRLVGIERFVVPVAVGIFLSLVLYELIPETLAAAPQWGGLAVAAGFIGFYVFAQYLHRYFHASGTEDCDRKSSAVLLLVGDAFHNVADGIILGGAFLIDPTVGVATAIGLAFHEIPQEIVEFGVFIRAGYTRMQAALRNLLSASGIIVGTGLVMGVAEHGGEWIWVLTGIAAGNLLFLAASDLLPRIHGNLHRYGSIWYATTAILIGFLGMTIVIDWAHGTMPHEGHSHGIEHHHDAHDHEAEYEHHHEAEHETEHEHSHAEEGHEHAPDHARE